MRQRASIKRAPAGWAARSLQEIADLPHSRRDLLIRNRAPWCTAETALGLAEHAFLLRYSNIAAAVEIAGAAAEILTRLTPPPAAEVRVLVLAHNGNALRIAGDFRAASGQLARAERSSHADCAPGARALVLEFRASLAESRRRFADALALLDSAAEIRRDAGDPEALAKIDCKRGMICSYAEQPDRAILFLRRALRNVRRDHDLARAVMQNLMWALVSLGRIGEATQVLSRSVDLLRGGGELYQFKLGWLRGRLAVGSGDAGAARAEFEDARRAYDGRGMLQEGAAVSLDLALLEWACGCAQRASEVLAEAEPIFAALGIERDALASRLLRNRAEAPLAGRLARELLRRMETGAAFQRRPGAS